MSKQSKRGCLELMRDQAWGFVFGVVSLVLALTSIILALPQAAPIRTGISQTIAGTTPTSEIPTVPPATLIPVPTPKVIPENLNIVCLNCNRFFAYSLKLNTIEIDYSNH